MMKFSLLFCVYLEKIKILKKGLKMRGTAIISLQNSL